MSATASTSLPSSFTTSLLWMRWNDLDDVGRLWSLRIAIAVVILSLVSLLWTRWVRVRIEARKPFAVLPMLPCNHFFWGHLLFLFQLDFDTATRMADEASNDYGLVGYWIFGQPSFWMTQWEDARAVLLATDFRSLIFLARYHLSMALGPRNILLLKGRDWKFHRTAILKSLVRLTSGTQQQQAVAAVVSHLIQSLHTKLQDNTTTTNTSSSIAKSSSLSSSDETTDATSKSSTAFPYLEMDVEPLMKMITMDVFGKTALSTDFQCCEHLAPSPLASAFDFLGSDLTRRIRSPLSLASFWYSLPTRLNRHHSACRTRLRTFLSDLIRQRRAVKTTATSDNTGNTSDLLSLLIQASDEARDKGEEDDVLADQTLSDVLMSLVFAGYDTTSICLTYAFYLLASHPVEQEYCFREAQRLLLSDTLDDVNVDDLVFCKAVILEALRLFPPAFLVNRSIDKDLPLRGGFVAPSGANAVISIWTLQRLEHNFPCPNDFRPDRWAKRKSTAAADAWEDRSGSDNGDDDSNGSSTIAPGNMNALLAFSAGSRSCPGQKFAMQEAILVLAGLVEQFEFRLVPGYQLQPVRQGLVQSPKGGMPLLITPR